MIGIGVSPGISIGRAYVLRAQKAMVSGKLLADADAAEAEVARYREAVRLSVEEVQAMLPLVSETERDILEVQLELLQDEQLEEDVLGQIVSGRMMARDAVLVVTEAAVKVFGKMEDEYMRERGADVRDAGNRIVRKLEGMGAGIGGSATGVETMEAFEKGAIVIAEELTPSDTIGMNREKVIGFATQIGGQTSHAAIVARLRGMPAVVGVGAGLSVIVDGDLVIVDGTEGEVLVNPPATVIEEYRQRQLLFVEEEQRLSALKDQPAVTTDGVKIELLANIATAQDWDRAVEMGAEGVGLLRTELLFMARDTYPTEEEQFQFYKSILLKAGGRPVTIRTLDVGGDKPLPYLGLPKEENPFLGYRAIRISLDRVELFLTQLRAILRASVFGQCRILLPMISGVEEVRRAKEIFLRAKEELLRAGAGFDSGVAFGIMIEVPSAAVIADLLAKEVDFFSIGTNDLCQYVLAADRMNERIRDLYDPYHPAVLRLIRQVIGYGHAAGIPVGMCGELAGDPQATSLLLGMGLREFSMSAGSIPLIKDVILRSNADAAQKNFQL